MRYRTISTAALMATLLGTSLIQSGFAASYNHINQGNINQSNVHQGWTLGGALTFGGDTVGQVEVITSFNDVETEKLKAGGTFYVYGGYVWPVKKSESGYTTIQTTIGYHFDMVTAGDDSVSFDRFPLDIILYHVRGGWRMGVGGTYHFSPTLDLKDAGDSEYSFDDALGVVVEFGKELHHNQSVWLRYTHIDYSIYSSDLDGANVGFGYSFQF